MDISGIQLIEDRVLILPDKQIESDNEIYSGEPKPADTGLVVKVGKGIQAQDTGVWIDMQVKEGDRVYFDRFAAIPYMDSEYLEVVQGRIRSIIPKI